MRSRALIRYYSPPSSPPLVRSGAVTGEGRPGAAKARMA